MGLPQPYRLKSSQAFRQIYSTGDRYRGIYFTLYTWPSRTHRQGPEFTTSSEVAKIGISVSQKISKKAVIRNRIKRQVRGILLTLLPRLQPGWQLVISARPVAVECKYEHFLRELKQLLINAKIIQLEIINGD